MKADISIPNPLYEASERLAKKLGISLSELYAAALTSFVSTHQRGEVTEALNQIYTTEPSKIEPALIKIQTASIGGKTW